MDLQELREEKMKQMQALEEEKMRLTLQRQMRILNKEKDVYASKTNNYINKIQITLGFLQHEKPIELENYLATQSESVERKYAREEAMVRELVKTTDIVKDLLAEEKEANKKLNKQILKVKAEEFETRKAAMLDSIERNKFRVPSQHKMDSRVEQANKRYHIQRMNNTELKDKIDNALITREIFCREEAKKEKELSVLHNKILQVMAEASQCYEERDRNEGTRLKLLEHLTKVKESCVKELQGLTSALTEDKEMETFMRIKQKDKGGYIRDKRAAEKLKIKEMLKQRDEYSLIFDQIKEAIGKDDMQEIVQDFVEKEEDNFAMFNSICELMDDNERLRYAIRDLGSDNVQMEMMDMDLSQQQQEGIKAVQDRIALLTRKKAECEKRTNKTNAILDEFYENVKTLISILSLDTSQMKNFNDGVLSPHNIIPILTDIEAEIANLLRDFTMVELATRATMYNKTQLTQDQVMLMRRPSLHIKPSVPPKFTPLSANKPIDTHLLKESSLMTFQEVKDTIVQNMMDDNKPETISVSKSSVKTHEHAHKTPPQSKRKSDGAKHEGAKQEGAKHEGAKHEGAKSEGAKAKKD